MPRISSNTLDAIARRLREVPRPSRTVPGPGRRPNRPVGMFPVLLEQDGGSDGTISTPATYTYTAYTLDGGTVLGVAMTPQKQRPNGSRLSGDGRVGLIYYDQSGLLVLFDANEASDSEAC